MIAWPGPSSTLLAAGVNSRDSVAGIRTWVWQGRLISTYVNSPGNRYNKAVADLGLNCYLKMLLNDNFIHADLHPGAPARPSVAGNAASSTAC